jgi:hypothetical protein
MKLGQQKTPPQWGGPWLDDPRRARWNVETTKRSDVKTKLIATIAATLALFSFLPTHGSALGLGKACGLSSGSCDKGLFCEKKPGQCFIRDLPGTCTKIPNDCPQDTGWRLKVCGCNGETCPNDCTRLRAGISLAHKGKCE